MPLGYFSWKNSVKKTLNPPTATPPPFWILTIELLIVHIFGWCHYKQRIYLQIIHAINQYLWTLCNTYQNSNVLPTPSLNICFSKRIVSPLKIDFITLKIKMYLSPFGTSRRMKLFPIWHNEMSFLELKE